MRFSKKLFLVFLLVGFSTYLTLYTVAVHIVGLPHIYDSPDAEDVFWVSGPSGSLFPWPREPGMLEVLTKLGEVDLFIYRYLAKTYVLAGLSVLMWVVTCVAILKIRLK